MDARGKRLRSSKEEETALASKDASMDTGSSSQSGLYPTDNRLLDILLHTRAESLRVPGNTVFIAERTDRLVDVFKGLVKYNFLSVPVIQKTGKKFYGFLDMSDIVHYVVELFGNAKLESNRDFWALIDKEEEFRLKTVKDVMKNPQRINNPNRPVRDEYSLLHPQEIMAREIGVHCVAIVDRERNLVNIVTQMQLTSFIVTNFDLLGKKAEKPIKHIDGALKEVVKIRLEEKAIEAFKLMTYKDISGVAVIDAEGKIVDTLSLRDLKAMAPDAGLFWRLFGTVKDFLEKLEQERLGGRPLSLQVCSPNDLFGDVVKRLVENKIHRIFIVNARHVPTGVISLKDVLREILNKD